MESALGETRFESVNLISNHYLRHTIRTYRVDFPSCERQDESPFAVTNSDKDTQNVDAKATCDKVVTVPVNGLQTARER